VTAPRWRRCTRIQLQPQVHITVDSVCKPPASCTSSSYASCSQGTHPVQRPATRQIVSRGHRCSPRILVVAGEGFRERRRRGRDCPPPRVEYDSSILMQWFGCGADPRRTTQVRDLVHVASVRRPRESADPPRRGTRPTKASGASGATIGCPGRSCSSYTPNLVDLSKGRCVPRAADLRHRRLLDSAGRMAWIYLLNQFGFVPSSWTHEAPLQRPPQRHPSRPEATHYGENLGCVRPSRRHPKPVTTGLSLPSEASSCYQSTLSFVLLDVVQRKHRAQLN
jgi:hypothetical protein